MCVREREREREREVIVLGVLNIFSCFFIDLFSARLFSQLLVCVSFLNQLNGDSYCY